MRRFTVIPEDTFKGLQLDAGIVLRRFNPANPIVNDEDIVCATTGGIKPSCVSSYSDLGSDVDNCPDNMMELKHLDTYDCKMAFTSIGTSKESIRLALGAADINADTGAIVPRRDLKQSDFADLWWVGDRADGGFVAIKLINALSTGGFSLQTTKNGKGQISVELTGHVSIKKQDVMPMVIYSIDPVLPFDSVTVTAEDQATTVFNTPVSDIQGSDVAVNGKKIAGTLKYLSSGPIVDYWGAGNFLVLKFADIDADATSVKVGLEPSAGSGLVEIIDDPDKNGVFKISDKDDQVFKVVISDGTESQEQEYDLTGLVLNQS